MTRSRRRAPPVEYSLDGQCGKAHGGLQCDPNSANYKVSLEVIHNDLDANLTLRVVVVL